jgi:hypothetical protein
MSRGFRSPSRCATSSALVASPHSTRWSPRIQRSPVHENGRVRQRRGRVGVLLVLKQQELVNLARIKTGQRQIIVQVFDLFQLQREELFVPRGPFDGSIHEEPKGLDLRRRPLVAQDDRDFFDPELARCLQPEVAIYDLAIAAGQHRDLKSELTDRSAHPIHDRIVLPGIARILDQALDRPGLNLLTVG